MTDTPPVRHQTIERLARYIDAVMKPHPLRVAIDGRTAAGKTTIANDLVAPLLRLGRTAIRIEIDEFHHPYAVRRGRTDLSPERQYYLYSYNLDAVRQQLLLPLGPDGDRCYRSRVFDSLQDVAIDEPVRLAPVDAVVLTDGVFLFRPELDDMWDIRILVEVDAAHSLQRGPRRDLAWMASIEQAEAKYHSTYIPGEDHYVALVDPRRRADVIVDNREVSAPGLRFRH